VSANAPTLPSGDNGDNADVGVLGVDGWGYLPVLVAIFAS
jgi:hypothetical protein